MTEAYESVLRKALDSADRRGKLVKWFKAIGLVFIVLGAVSIWGGMENVRELRPDILYIATCAGMVLFFTGLFVCNIAISVRNTQLILRAVSLVSSATGSAPLPASPDALDKQRG